jgi:hypothetical protein
VSLIVITFKKGDALEVLGPLAVAAAAAAAAGRPWPLQTLRVLGCDGPTTQLTGKLVAHLPNLHTLDAKVSENVSRETTYVQKQLAPLKQAVQLQELYLQGPSLDSATVAPLLPTGLRRLAWEASFCEEPLPDLSHLTHLSFLQLLGWDGNSMDSSGLPPGLQQLQLDSADLFDEEPKEVLEEQRKILIGLESRYFPHKNVQHVLSCPNLRTATLTATALQDPAACEALGQLPHLVTLKVCKNTWSDSHSQDLDVVVPAAASLRNLQHLLLDLPTLPPAAGLAALTGLTRLTVAVGNVNSFIKQQQLAWAEEMGRMPALKWLSVPGQLLLVARPWLGGLKQLRVLVLSRLVPRFDKHGSEPSTMERIVQQLEGSSPLVLPPRLLLLGLTGISVQHAAGRKLCRRVRCLLTSSGCEVVGGPDLDEVADPTQQLAGLPVALQQALLA